MEEMNGELVTAERPSAVDEHLMNLSDEIILHAAYERKQKTFGYASLRH